MATDPPGGDWELNSKYATWYSISYTGTRSKYPLLEIKTIVYYITRHESNTLLTKRRVEEYEDAKRPSTSSSLRVTHRHFHAA
jgi:hypothetical protein